MTRSTINKVLSYMHRRGMSIEELASSASIDCDHLNHLVNHPIYVTEEEVKRLDETLNVPSDETGLVFDTWGQKVEYYRTQREMPQRVLADKAGVNRGTVSRWETDKRGAPQDARKIEQIDDFLKVPAKYRGIPSNNAADNTANNTSARLSREAYIANTFHNLAEALEYYRKASEQEKDRLREHLPGEHIGYFLGFVESLFRPNDDPGAFERFTQLNKPFDYKQSHQIGGKKC